MPKTQISACLLGERVRHDEKDCLQNHPRLQNWFKSGRIIAIYPEMAGGLPTPRPPAEVHTGKTSFDVLKGKGKVISINNVDVTSQYISGGYKALVDEALDIAENLA